LKDKRWAAIERGVVGHFTPWTDTDLEAVPGLLRLNRDQRAEIVLAVDDSFLTDGYLPPDCPAIIGATEVGQVLIMGVRQRNGTRGGYPTARYRAQSVALDVEVDAVDGDLVVGARLGYDGLQAWSGASNLSDDPVRNEDGTLAGWRVDLTFQDPTSCDLDSGFRLSLAPGWSLDGPRDLRTIAAPMYFRVESETRQEIGKHLQRLDAIQALLAVCGFPSPLASTGNVRLCDGGDWYDLWEYEMTTRQGPVARIDFPYLTLAEISDVHGVANWVGLTLRHRRAVEPIVRHALFQNQTPESRLLATAAAIEYWVSCNARNAEWARKDGRPLPNALARRVGGKWNDWIGRPTPWADRFWDAYLDLKHYRRVERAPAEVHALEVSGRWLLTAALLNDCAGANTPSEMLFGQSLWQIGKSVRETLYG
jgi:hypothetical protein